MRVFTMLLVLCFTNLLVGQDTIYLASCEQKIPAGKNSHYLLRHTIYKVDDLLIMKQEFYNNSLTPIFIQPEGEFGISINQTSQGVVIIAAAFDGDGHTIYKSPLVLPTQKIIRYFNFAVDFALEFATNNYPQGAWIAAVGGRVTLRELEKDKPFYPYLLKPYRLAGLSIWYNCLDSCKGYNIELVCDLPRY